MRHAIVSDVSMDAKTTLLYVGLLVALSGMAYGIIQLLNAFATDYEWTDRSVKVIRRGKLVHEILLEDICRVYVGNADDYRDAHGVRRLWVIRNCSSSPFRAVSDVVIIETKTPPALYFLTPPSPESFAQKLPAYENKRA